MNVGNFTEIVWHRAGCYFPGLLNCLPRIWLGRTIRQDGIAGPRRPIPGGASISKAYDLLKGHSALPRKSQLSKDWSEFRDVAHLIAAAAVIAFASRDQQAASAVLTPVLLVPDVVLAFGIAYQEFGLSLRPHGQRDPVLPPETLWRIPDAQDAPMLPLPVRRLSDEDLKYLTTRRRARRRR